MKKIILALLIAFIAYSLDAQQGDGGTPYLVKTISYKNIPNYHFEKPDIERLRIEDKINDSLRNGPWRFGYNYNVSLDLFNSGTWFDLANGGKVWMLRITAAEAQTINLTFSNTRIPEGNELYIYNSDQSFVLGKFTQNHIYSGELGAELVHGDESFVQYYVAPQNYSDIGSVEISTVTYGYRTAREYQEKAFGSSGSCNMNVNCPDGEIYQDQRNSAVMLVSGSNGFCSAALINNTNFDGKPYVLTANHCFSNNVASWIFRFNWQASGCSNPSSSPSYQSLSGAELRARRQPSDMCLVEITGGLENNTVPLDYNPYFAGWNRLDEPSEYTFCIHHPAGDIKKISFDDHPPLAVQAMNSSEANSSWKVIWDRNTVTEGGSSGSPLFNEKGQIIGQLWGGSSSCSNAGTQNAYDYYGRIHNSWEPSGSANSAQLKHWLDPLGNGTFELGGHDPQGEPVLNDASVSSLSGYEGQICENSFVPEFRILNKGIETLTTLTINYDYGSQGSGTIDWTGSLATYQSEIVQLPTYYNQEGNNQISVTVSQPNGVEDENPNDNSVQVSFIASPQGTTVELTFYMACWPEENSWEVLDQNSNVLYSGGGFSGSANTNFVTVEQFCLPDGCYKLKLKDTYGDGVAGSQYSSCDYDGSMTLVQVSNDSILAQLTEEEASFGYEISFDFCLSTLSLDEHSLSSKVNVYPNPSSNGEFYVDMDFFGEKEVVLMQPTGQIIGKYNTNDNQLRISEKQLASGVYFVVISSSNEKVVRKLIVE